MAVGEGQRLQVRLRSGWPTDWLLRLQKEGCGGGGDHAGAPESAVAWLPTLPVRDHRTVWRLTDLGDGTVTISCSTMKATTTATTSSDQQPPKSKYRNHQYLTATAAGWLVLTDEITGDGARWIVTKTSPAGVSFLNVGAQKFLALRQHQSTPAAMAHIPQTPRPHTVGSSGELRLYLSSSLAGPAATWALSPVHGFSFRLRPVRPQKTAHVS